MVIIMMMKMMVDGDEGEDGIMELDQGSRA